MEEDLIFFEMADVKSHIILTPLERIIYNSDLDWDKNWLNVKVEIKSGSFKGNYTAQLLTTYFDELKKALTMLYENLKWAAEISDIERYLKLYIKGDGIGHFEVSCEAIDKPGIDEAKLQFDLSFDQTQIMPMIMQLDAITTNYPIIGRL